MFFADYFSLNPCYHLTMSGVANKRKRTSSTTRPASKRSSGGNSRSQQASKKRTSQSSPSLSRPSELPNSLAVLDSELGKFPTNGDKRSVDTFLSKLTDDLIEALIIDVTTTHGTKFKSAPSQSPRTAKPTKPQASRQAPGSAKSPASSKAVGSNGPPPVNKNVKSAQPALADPVFPDDPHIEEVVIDSGHVNDHLSSEEPRPRRRVKRLPKRRHSPTEDSLIGEISEGSDDVSPEQNHEKREKKRLKLTKQSEDETPSSKNASYATTDLGSTTAKNAGAAVAGSRLPWWRSTQNRVTVLDNPPNVIETFRGYVKAIVKACVNASWTTADLRAAFDGDPCSEKGKAFRDISTSLVLMERARHMGHCRARWHRDIVSGLVSRRYARWSKLSMMEDNDFMGCDICGSVRPATERLTLSGEKLDGREFWPDQMRIDILSMRKLSDDGSYSLTVEVNREEISNGIGEKDAEKREDDKTYYVDSQCLRQCLVFHRLVHATNIVSGEVRGMIEDELREGVVELKVKPGVGDRSVLDALEEELMNCVLARTDYPNRQVTSFLDMLKLGDLYLSAEESEVIDSGCAEDELERTKNIRPTIYDAPLYLGDERFASQVTRLVAMSQVFGS